MSKVALVKLLYVYIVLWLEYDAKFMVEWHLNRKHKIERHSIFSTSFFLGSIDDYSYDIR